MESRWKVYSEIKRIIENHGFVTNDRRKYDAFIRNLLDLLDL